MKPLCFVLMPFGNKKTNDNRMVCFDVVYKNIVRPAVEKAGMEPLRADEEKSGGIIHKAMYERLILCEYAIADLTTANANVFYELGIRHAIKPRATQLVYAEGWGQLPFDVQMLRALSYKLDADGKPINVSETIESLSNKLKASIQPDRDSPLYQLLNDFPAPDIARLKTDAFRERVCYADNMKSELYKARCEGEGAIVKIEKELGDVSRAEAAIVIDLFLSYRAVKAWKRMIRLVDLMSPALASTIMVREQLGFALNRNKQHREAEQVLLKLIKERGGSSETYGILGRVYKDLWEDANKKECTSLTQGFLDKAITTYLKGFEIDLRDAYPGINAATLMELKNPSDIHLQQLLTVLRYVTERRIINGNPDYWDYATQFEIAVLSVDEKTGKEAIANALPLIREKWEPETTARNLSLIRWIREQRGIVVDWANKAEEELIKLST